MRLNYIERIKANLSLSASKKATTLLDGLHHSVYKGKSLDFDDLRDYVIGDNHKDIDWKSSVRHGSLLVRRYEAFRRHNVLFVIDTRESMTGIAPSGETKSSLALFAFGTLGYIVSRSDDEIGATYARGNQIEFQSFKAGLPHLERTLTILDCITVPGERNISELLSDTLRHQRRRLIFVVISDLKGLKELGDNLLRKIAVNHDLLFISIGDADMTSEPHLENYDLEEHANIPHFLQKNRKLKTAEQEIKKNIFTEQSALLRRFQMTTVVINSKTEIADRLIDLLERHNHAVSR